MSVCGGGVFSVIETYLTVTNKQSRQFPTVLLAGHVHSNKLISLINREEQQGPRTRRKGIWFFLVVRKNLI